MRVFTQTNVKSSNPVLFGEIRKSQPNLCLNKTKKNLKQKLSLMILSNQWPLGNSNNFKEKSRQQIIKHNLILPLEIIKPNTNINKRSHSLCKTPKPTSYRKINVIENTKQIVYQNKNTFLHSRKSCHSLGIKQRPSITLSIFSQDKMSYKQNSRSTSISKSPLTSQRKLDQFTPIPQHIDSSVSKQSQIVKEIQIKPGFKNINSLCKNIQKSFCYQNPQQIPIKHEQDLSFFKRIPSTQLHHQYAISYEITDQQSFVSKNNELKRFNKFK